MNIVELRSIAARTASNLAAYEAAHPSQFQKAAPVPMQVIDPRRLDGVMVPERQWLVPGWLPSGHATILYGDGGTGKTLLAQQLMTACATGTRWCGLDVARCRTFALLCEDEPNELHRRQAAINAAMGLSFADLMDMRYVSGVGQDNLLVTFDRAGVMTRTKLFHDLEREAVMFGARLIVVDTAADTFGGDDIKRAQVRQFVGNALNGLAQRIGGAVLLTAHPSRSGMAQGGDQDGGSTAWSGSARARWALTRATGKDAATADPDARVLSRRKANYSSIGDTIDLRWSAGVMLPEGQVDFSGLAGSRDTAMDVTFLRLFDAHTAAQPEAMLSPSANATFCAAKVLAGRSDAGGANKRDLDRAMTRLLERGALALRSVGRPRDGRRYLVRAGDGGGDPGSSP